VADLDQQLADGIVAGRLTGEDVEEIHRFREFLRLTKERGVAAMLADPQWRAYALGEEEVDGGR
jgi:hypothetical protein